MAVAAYLVWRAWVAARQLRQRQLRRRVAYLLWVMALEDDAPAVPWSPLDDLGLD